MIEQSYPIKLKLISQSIVIKADSIFLEYLQNELSTGKKLFIMKQTKCKVLSRTQYLQQHFPRVFKKEIFLNKLLFDKSFLFFIFHFQIIFVFYL